MANGATRTSGYSLVVKPQPSKLVMRVRFPLPAPVLLALAVAGCGSSAADRSTEPQAPVVAAASSAPATTPTLEQTASQVPASSSSTPEVSSTIEHGTPEQALHTYYGAINAGDFSAAWDLWAHDGKASGQSLSAFSEGFAETRSSDVAVTGPVRTEGAAGSLYATVPVEVSATMKDGAHQDFTGHYVLRRVNDVPGASAEQLRWHIFKASLRPR